MARLDCKLERNVRIYKAYQRGVRIKRLAELENISASRVTQIIAFAEQKLNAHDMDYLSEFSQTKTGGSH